MRTVLEICSGLRAPGTLAILLVASGGQAQVRSQYEVTVIQAPECPIFGWPPTWGLGLDEQGHVVGYHWQCGIGNPGWGDHEAFVWTPETGMVDLPRPGLPMPHCQWYPTTCPCSVPIPRQTVGR